MARTHTAISALSWVKPALTGWVFKPSSIRTSHLIIVLSAAGLLGFVTACQDDGSPLAPDSLSDRVAIQVVLHQFGPNTLDKELTVIAERIPGFGGMFYDDTGTLTMYLVDESKSAEAQQAVRDLAQLQNRETVSEVRVRKGEFDFASLSLFKSALNSVFSIPGVVFTDVDESRNRVLVAVTDVSLQDAILKEALRLGIPSSAVIVEKTEPIERFDTLGDWVRPIAGGQQILGVLGSTNKVCSMGFLARRSGLWGFVTNSHCTAVFGGVENTQFYQPTNANSTWHVGTEHVDPNFIGLPGCPPASLCRWSDSAFVRLGTVWFDPGKLKRTSGLGSVEIIGTWTITGEAAYPFVGELVNKVGTNSGWTQGLVTNTCVDFAGTQDPDGLLCQDIAAADIEGGDSGAPVFSISGTNATLFGVAWGGGSGQTVFSAMGNIEQELGNLTTSF